MMTPPPARADCALCGKRILCVNGRWTHLKYGYSAAGERHTATPRKEKA